MKKTVWITVGSILSVLIVGLLVLGSCSKSRSSESHSSESRYQVEYEQRANWPRLEVKVKGPAAKLAIILANPKGETDIKIVSEEKMIDNIETVYIGWERRMAATTYSHLWGHKAGAPTYTLLVKTFEPEKVVYRENLKFRRGGWLVRNSIPPKNKEKQLNVSHIKSKIYGMWTSSPYRQVLELKKDGTFYLDKTICRKAVLESEKRTGLTGLARLERTREAFPNVTTPKVVGRWKIEGGFVVLTTDSGATLRGKTIEAKKNSGRVYIYIIDDSPTEAEWYRADQKYLESLYAKYGR